MRACMIDEAAPLHRISQSHALDAAWLRLHDERDGHAATQRTSELLILITESLVRFEKMTSHCWHRTAPKHVTGDEACYADAQDVHQHLDAGPRVRGVDVHLVQRHGEESTSDDGC